MKLGVSELCDRYSIKSRKSLYSRLDGLNITLDKDGNKSYATEEQIKLLDQQNEHIKEGGTLKSFTPTATVEVTVHDTATQHNQDTASIVETAQHTPQLSTPSILLGDIVQNISLAIALLKIARSSEGLLQTPASNIQCSPPRHSLPRLSCDR